MAGTRRILPGGTVRAVRNVSDGPLFQNRQYIRAFANEFHPGPGDIMLQYSVCSFDIFVEEVFASLLNGAALAIPSEGDKAFVALPDGGTMYRSGDLGYLLPSGDIAFLHRKDTQIMIYGKRVEVVKVESRLYQCKNVQQAVVRAFTDEDGLSYMTAYVVPANQDMRVSALSGIGLYRNAGLYEAGLGLCRAENREAEKAYGESTNCPEKHHRSGREGTQSEKH